ncbi:MAG: peptide chain release factor-like protein [Myxococcaceae bacterium]|nr:peptide chain release factor-like protein [Myxococcaceae bacterium]
MPTDPSKQEAARRALALDDDALAHECEVDVFIASGPGGQHRNRTKSGVRLTHRPTGVTVTATERRSQAQNRSVAKTRLRAALKALSFVRTVRRPTKPTRSAQRRRVETKRRHGEKKRLRSGHEDV